VRTETGDAHAADPLDGPEFATAVLTAAPDGVFVVDPAGIIRRVNPAAEALFGYTSEELVGRPVDDLVPAAQRAAHAAHREVYGRGPTRRPMGAQRDLWGRQRDGTPFPVEISLSPLGIGGQGWVIAVVRDVTARRTFEAERRRQQAQEEVRRFRGRVAMDLHDDLLQQVIGLGLHLEHTPAAQLATPAGARERVRWAADELRTVSRALRGFIRTMTMPQPAGDLASSLEGLRQELERAGVRTTVHLPDDAPPLAAALALELFQVAHEACTNILRHAAAQSATLELLVRRESVLLCIHDDGVGFEPQGDAPAGHYGLHNMRARIQGVGGRFSVRSGAGQGTLVEAEVPHRVAP
jgi:PAS domain S-box-containing protein